MKHRYLVECEHCQSKWRVLADHLPYTDETAGCPICQHDSDTEKPLTFRPASMAELLFVEHNQEIQDQINESQREWQIDEENG